MIMLQVMIYKFLSGYLIVGGYFILGTYQIMIMCECCLIYFSKQVY